MTKTQRGFSIPELMVTVAVLATVAGIAAGLGSQAWQDHATMSGYQTDVQDVRRALVEIESDLRVAQRIRSTADATIIETPTERVTYQLEVHELRRIDSNGRARTVARCVSGLDIATDGALAHVTLRLRRRITGGPTPTRPAAQLTTSILMRNSEATR